MIKATFLVSLLSAVFSFNAYAQGDAEAGQAKAAMCFACHGTDGNSIAPNFPNLAGQGEKYMVKQLHDFKANDARKDSTMIGMVAALSDQDMENVAAFFSAQKLKVASTDKVNTLGQNIYRGGITSAKIPACMACHGPDGSGNPAAGYPALSGQKAAYVVKQLKAFRSGERKNDAAKMMRNVALRMTDAEIEAVASYINSLH